MVETQFMLPAIKRESQSLAGAAPLLVPLGIGLAGGLAVHPVALFLTIPAALLVGGLASVGMVAAAPKQSHHVTLESDGATVWAYHSIAPTEQKRRARLLFSLPLDQVGACESGNAYQMFGNVNYAGKPLFPSFSWGSVQANYERMTAIFLRCGDGLRLLGASDTSTALTFQVVTQINGFLADARALRSAPSAAASSAGNASSPRPSSPASGFDL